MDRGAWWAAVYGVAQSWARLKRLSSSSSSSSNVFEDQVSCGTVLQVSRAQEICAAVPGRLGSVCCVLGVETIVNREVVTKVLGSERDPKKGFHSDVEDSLSEFSFSLVNCWDYLSTAWPPETTPGPCTSPPSSNELDSGFCLLNLKNDSLRKRYEGLKYDVKKVKKVVCHLSIRGCNREPAAACVKRGAPRRPCWLRRCPPGPAQRLPW